MSQDSGLSRAFSEILCDFSYVPFLLPNRTLVTGGKPSEKNTQNKESHLNKLF